MIPRPPRALPESLVESIFTTSDALGTGVNPNRLRRRDLDARVRGVRGSSATSSDLESLCELWAARLPPNAFFSHSTAARLHGVPLPRRLEASESIHVSVEADARAPHAIGLIGHSRFVVAGDVVILGRLRVSSAERVICELANMLDLAELVAAVDYLIHRRRRSTRVGAIVERLEVGDPLTRSRRLRRAIELSDDRAESAPESHLRVLCSLNGLGRPESNWNIVDTVSGRDFRLDLAWPDHLFAIEYHGDYHRARDQWRRDLTRKSNLEALGWRILELTADDLRDEAALTARIRVALSRA